MWDYRELFFSVYIIYKYFLSFKYLKIIKNDSLLYKNVINRDEA